MARRYPHAKFVFWVGVDSEGNRLQSERIKRHNSRISNPCHILYRDVRVIRPNHGLDKHLGERCLAEHRTAAKCADGVRRPFHRPLQNDIRNLCGIAFWHGLGENLGIEKLQRRFESLKICFDFAGRANGQTANLYELAADFDRFDFIVKLQFTRPMIR